MCPKVPYTSNVSLFSAVCGWIPKPFDLLIATAVRFCLVQRWARSRSLILIFQDHTGDLDLLGDLDQFQIDLDLWVIFDLWSSIFKIIFIPHPNMYIVGNLMAKTFHYNIIHGGITGFNTGYWSIIQRCEKLFQRDWNCMPQCSQATWPAHAQPISQFLKV